MKKAIAAAIVLLLVLAALLFWWTMRVAPPVAEQVPTEPRPQPVPEAKVEFPVMERTPPVAEPPAAAQPPVSAGMEEILVWLFDGKIFERYLVSDNFIQRFVVLVDSLPRDQLPANRLPTRPLPGEFLVRGGEGELVIDPENYSRYDPFLDMVEGVDPAQAVDVYARLYPRFQKSYEQLGYPGYFNDRLVAVIDHLLATPRVEQPIRLRRPKIRYVYAEPRIEAMSAGRKLLIRTGPENIARIKKLLGEYRQELVDLGRQPGLTEGESGIN